MRKGFMIFTLVVAMAEFKTAAGASDEEVRDLIVGSGQYIDNFRLAREAFQYARECCGDDSNRFARLLFELAQTNNVRIADRMIRCLGRYGTTNQLSFLYSLATNEQYGASAVQSILRIEGLSVASVNVTSNYLFSAMGRDRDRYYVCERLVDCVRVRTNDVSRCLAQGVALHFMASRNIYHDWLDKAMLRADPSYETSRRRLTVLRTVLPRINDQREVTYVTNAINTLVAYPEANLPE